MDRGDTQGDRHCDGADQDGDHEGDRSPLTAKHVHQALDPWIDATAAWNSGYCRARRRLVASQPAGVPTSSSSPSNSNPQTTPDSSRRPIASVSWISPSAPGLVSRSAPNIGGVGTYLP